VVVGAVMEEAGVADMEEVKIRYYLEKIKFRTFDFESWLLELNKH
jgi:hypothetical protein